MTCLDLSLGIGGRIVIRVTGLMYVASVEQVGANFCCMKVIYDVLPLKNFYCSLIGRWSTAW